MFTKRSLLVKAAKNLYKNVDCTNASYPYSSIIILKLERQQLLIYEAAHRSQRERQGLFSYKVGFKVMLRSAAR